MIKLIVLVFGLTIFLNSCYTVNTELVIPAQPEKVWAVLMDEAGYNEWNPDLVPIDGEIKEGNILTYRMTDAEGKQSDVEAEVIKLEKEKVLNQFGGLTGILTFDHYYILKAVQEGTHVTQHEEYKGIWVPFWDASWVEPAYNKVNQALRERVKQLEESK